MSIEITKINTQRRFGEAANYVFVWTYSPWHGKWRALGFTIDAIEEAAEFAEKHAEDCPPRPSRFWRVMQALFGP